MNRSRANNQAKKHGKGARAPRLQAAVPSSIGSDAVPIEDASHARSPVCPQGKRAACTRAAAAAACDAARCIAPVANGVACAGAATARAGEGSAGCEAAISRRKRPSDEHLEDERLCEEHLLTMEKLRALFRGSFSALTSELVAFAAAVQDCERDISGGSQAQKEERRRRLCQLGRAAIATVESCALASAASQAAIEVLKKGMIQSEKRHRERDAFLVENLVKPVVARVGGSVAAATLEGALLSLTQMLRGEVSYNVNETVRTYEDGEAILDFDPPIYVPLALAERLKDLEIRQAKLLAELPKLARDYDAVFGMAGQAAVSVVQEAQRASAGSPLSIEWQSFFACVDVESYKRLINAFGAAAASAAKRADGIFSALAASAKRHRLKDKRDEVLLDCLRAVSEKRGERDADLVAAILEELDCARKLADRQDASRSCKRNRGDGAGAGDGTGSSAGGFGDINTGAPPPPPPPPEAAAAAAGAAVAHAAAFSNAEAASPSASAAASAAISAVVENRAAYAVLPSGPTIVVDEEMIAIETEAGGRAYVQHHAAAHGSARQENGNGNAAADENAADDSENADSAANDDLTDGDDDLTKAAHELFFAHWLPPSTRTPEQIAEMLRSLPPAIAATTWPAGQTPAEFRGVIGAPKERVSMCPDTGTYSVDLSELRTDQDVDGLAQGIRALMGAPQRDCEPATHASYVLLSNDCAPAKGAPPPHQPNIAVHPPRRFPRTRQRPQSQIDAEAAAAANAQLAVAQMQTMMAAAMEAATAAAAPIAVEGGSQAFF